jgi:hypothetical protein
MKCRTSSSISSLKYSSWSESSPVAASSFISSSSVVTSKVFHICLLVGKQYHKSLILSRFCAIYGFLYKKSNPHVHEAVGAERAKKWMGWKESERMCRGGEAGWEYLFECDRTESHGKADTSTLLVMDSNLKEPTP